MGTSRWLAIVLAGAWLSTAQAADGLVEVSGFGSNPGQLRMYEHVPPGLDGPAPLVVALHGCTQTAADYAGAGWNELADRAKFYVVYAEVPSSKTPQACFDWYDRGDIARDGAEPVSIAQMVAAMKARHAVDERRVFVTGLSAGGAMTAVMLAAYPDVFAAGAVMSGIPYGCATSQLDAYKCLAGVDQPAQAWGELARRADPGWTGPWPRLSVWQGDADYTVRPPNADALIAQWTNLLGLGGEPARDTVDGARHASFTGAGGRVAVESYLVPKMGHGTALEVGFPPAGGCGRAGAFLLDAGICSTWYAARFFGLVEDGAAPGPATRSDGGMALTGPAGGACAFGGRAGDARGCALVLVVAAVVFGSARRGPSRRRRELRDLALVDGREHAMQPPIDGRDLGPGQA